YEKAVCLRTIELLHDVVEAYRCNCWQLPLYLLAPVLQLLSELQNCSSDVVLRRLGVVVHYSQSCVYRLQVESTISQRIELVHDIPSRIGSSSSILGVNQDDDSSP